MAVKRLNEKQSETAFAFMILSQYWVFVRLDSETGTTCLNLAYHKYIQVPSLISYINSVASSYILHSVKSAPKRLSADFLLSAAEEETAHTGVHIMCVKSESPNDVRPNLSSRHN